MNGAVVTATASAGHVAPAVDRRSEARARYWTPDALAEAITRVFDCTVTPKTLANWRSAGKGPAFVKVGRQVRYNLDEVNRWFQAQRRNRGIPE